MVMVNFGDKLRKLRTEAGMTQSDLAKRLNITKSVVSYYELQERTPSPDVLIQLADIFHVSTDYLLGINHKKMIDVSDLSEEDMRFLLITIETLRKKNSK
jgi:transcriptional regulator with XRE-family HTH domain